MNENKGSQSSTSSTMNKLRKKFTLSFAFTFILISTIIIISIVPLILDLSKINDKGFQANLIINIVLTILTYIFFIIDYSNKMRVKDSFIKIVNKIVDLDKKITKKALSFIFKNFVSDYNKEKRIEYISAIFERNFIPNHFMECSLVVIDEALKDNLISQEQYNIIIKCRKDKLPIEQYEVSEMRTYKDYRRSSESVKSNRDSIVFWGIIPKIFYIIIFSTLMVSVTVDTLKNPDANAKAEMIVNLVTRLLNVISAIWLGQLQANTLIKDEVRIMEIKINFMEDFFSRYETGQWKPSINIEESVQEKLKEIDLEYRRKNGELFNESPGYLDSDSNVDTEIIEVSEEEYNKIMMKSGE